MQKENGNIVKNAFAVAGFMLAALLLCFFVFLPSDGLSANSAPLHYDEDPYADLIAETDSDISVLYEVLTFHFYEDSTLFYSPAATVTAEYTLDCNSAKTVRMGFPLENYGDTANLPLVIYNMKQISPVVYCFDYDDNRTNFDTLTFEEILEKTGRQTFEVEDIPHLNSYCFLLVYDVPLVPGRTNMSVTYEMAGSYDGTLTPAVYTYRYYTNPARNWASFGGMDIKIITNDATKYIIDSSVDFTETSYGYIYSGALPDENLSVSLCASQYPVESEGIFWIVVIFCIALGIPAVFFVIIIIVAIIASRQKYKYQRRN